MATETSSAVASQYTSPSYGSGSSSYGSSSSSSSYDSCVQQCVASYGMPSAMSMPSATASSGSYGSGATHTVYVAPTQGVLRYVPFAVNASVGDTVKFIWGGGPHTVTKSSVLGICNKTSDAPFASGVQNKSFTFTQMVNDTNATFFYCGVATHCQKGMFGIMNPPNAAGAASSVDAMMPTIAANDSATAAAWAYTTNITANNTGAAAWGGSMDMSGMPDWAMSDMAQNVMYTRAFLAANPEALAEDGTVDLSRISEGSIMNPPDVAALSAASPAPAAGASSASAAAGNAAASAPSAKVNGAGMISSPRVLVAFAAVGAAFFAL
ncbi:hypothetical protein OF83DRAFT_1059945 [Amylostereum chailletii]|nr:hypothetical protein OF83DRAFT_1059945 [Amylostereum chailletii]